MVLKQFRNPGAIKRNKMKLAKLYREIIILLIIVIIPGYLAAQNFKADIKVMKEAFAKIDRLHAEVEVKVFENTFSAQVIQTKKSTIRKDGNNYHYDLDNLSLLMNEKCMLLVHHDEKQIVYSKRDVNNEKQFGIGTLTPEVDTILRQYDSVIYKGISNKLKRYIIYSSKSKTIKRTEVFLDTKTAMIRKLIYYYNTELFPVGSKVIVDYKVFNTSPTFSSTEFSEKKYIEHGRELKPSKAFSAYSVFNYDPNKF